MYNENIGFAFILTLFAGLSTGIGSALAFFAKRTNTNFLSVALGFSAGVMIFVSFVEIFPEAKHSLISQYGDNLGVSLATLALFVGMLLAAGIDKLIPNHENPHEPKLVEDMAVNNSDKLYRMGIFSAIAIAVHNFPEGLATFVAALGDSQMGIAIAVAIAIHNIPEGIAVSVPIYYATGDRKKAFYLSFLSGLAEPVGAIIGYLLLLPFMNESVFGFLFALIAGIMIFISFDELLPASEKYGEHHLSIYGLIGGMLVMAISLLLL